MRKEGKTATFEQLKDCLIKFCCTKLQAGELKDQYENLKQTDSVVNPIREIKRLMDELADDETLAIGKGEAITTFFKHATEPVRSCTYEHVPEPDWWRQPEALFKAAHHYEVNKNAARPLKTWAVHAERKRKQCHGHSRH